MTVKELIDILSECPNDADVAIVKGRLLDFDFELRQFIDMDTNFPVIVFESKSESFTN